MAAKQRYTTLVVCPQCGEQGTLHVSEDDHPYMSSPRRAVDRVEGAFLASVSNHVEVQVICNKCNTEFVH